MSQTGGTSSRFISISPPPKRRRLVEDQYKDAIDGDLEVVGEPPVVAKSTNARFVPSPVKLNFIDKLHPASNIDTISLGSILGDVMIRECWLFNYLFDLDFVMSQFDPDVKTLVNVHVVHGSWKKEDRNRISIDRAARRYPNIDVVTAYMPEPFGTHHSKMMILFRHDDFAQVIILTGNLIQRDWSMSQAIWQSPLLPLLCDSTPYSPAAAPLGSGQRFKHDLMDYLQAYGLKLKDLPVQLSKYDFHEIKAALVASTPGKQHLRSTNPETETLWGWPGLKHVLSGIQKQPHHYSFKHKEQLQASKSPSKEEDPHIIIQVSSIASIGEKWLFNTLFPALSALSTNNTLGTHNLSCKPAKARFSIVFPNGDSIRKCVDGYGSGSSIHMKTQTPKQAKQLSDIRGMLCHWSWTESQMEAVSSPATPIRRAERGRAAPHIKTYIRFSDESMTNLDWGMVTSANLSTQAWGDALSSSGEVRICSYEIGVVVWPALFNETKDGVGLVEAQMVPAFGRDVTGSGGIEGVRGGGEGGEEGGEGGESGESGGGAAAGRGADVNAPQVQLDDLDGEEVEEIVHSGRVRRESREIVVGWRMPYDLPLIPYGKDDMPWCTTEPCSEPDWTGRVWPGHGR